MTQPLYTDLTEFDYLPPHGRDALVRLLSVIAALGSAVPEEMLDAIEAISIKGVDVDWQIQRLTEILDHWAPQQ